MAIWQFDTYVFPIELLVRLDGSTPSIITEDEFDKISWKNDQKISALPASLSVLEESRNSWSDEVRIWGEEDGNCVRLFLDGTIINSWNVRFDLRNFDSMFFTEIIDCAVKYNGMFIDANLRVIPASVDEMLNSIRKSDSYRFVLDPRKYMADWAARHEEMEE